MERIPNGRYTQEFCEEAVKMADDNAPMESFRGVFKNEQIHHCRN